MIKLKFLLIAAIVALAYSDIPPELIQQDIDSAIASILDHMYDNPQAYFEAFGIAEMIEQQLKGISSSNVARKKRQATAVDCTELKNRLAKDRADIELTNKKIQNSTITLTTLENQVRSYEAKVASSSGSALQSAKNLLAIYQKLLSATKATVENLKKQLAAFKASESQILQDIDKYCQPTTTTAPILNPCGTFLRYDSINSRTAPTVDGFNGGFYQSSPAYVGFGDGTSCNNQDLVPCAISTDTSTLGCYIPCGANEINSVGSAYYLMSHQDLTWFDADSSTVFSVQDPLRLLGPENFMFGRTLISNYGFVLGKIVTNNGVTVFEAVGPSGPIKLSSGFQVLACKSVSCPCSGSSNTTQAPTTNTPTEATSSLPTSAPNNTTSPPTSAPTTTAKITTTQEPFNPSKYPCGTFMKYDTVNQKNFPELYGFAGGIDYDSWTQYVGYGNNGGCGMPPQIISPGYISTYPSPGVFLSCANGITQENTNVYFLLKNDNLKWVNTDSASMMSVNNRLAINDSYYVWHFGRTDYQNSPRLGKVYTINPGAGLYFMNELNNEVTTRTFQILTCGPQTPSDVINSGQSLNLGDKVISSDGSTQLELRPDGNLVATSVATGAIIWQSFTSNSGVTKATMGSNGALTLTTSSGSTVWTSSSYSTPISGSNLKVIPGGFRIISSNGVVSYDHTSFASTTSSPSTTAEIITTQEPFDPKKYPCGTFMSYDPVNQRNFPELYGFAGGADYDPPFTQYVGYGNNGYCGMPPHTICPGFILTDPSAGPGVYLSCANGIKYDNKKAFFLLKNDNLFWVNTDSASMMSVNYRLAINDSNYLWHFGRSNYQNSPRLGKVYTINPGAGLYFMNENNVELHDTTFQILTCGPQTTQPPTTVSEIPITTVSPIIILKPGETLNAGSTISSPNGNYQLSLTNGNLVLQMKNGTTVWSSNTTGSGATSATMNSNGNIVLTNSAGATVWSTSSYTPRAVPGSSLQVTDSGQVVVSNGTFASFVSNVNSCPNILGTNQTLAVGETRTSCNGQYKVTLKPDGNLVVESLTGKVLWSTSTAGSGAIAFTMRPNGNGVLTGPSGNVIWQTSTFGPSLSGAIAQISDNGQLLFGTQSQTAFIGRERPQYACGTFLNHDTVSDRGGPLIEGFYIGNYLDSSRVYVGYSSNILCNGQTISPSRIRATSPAGGYVGRCGIEAYEPTTSFFLQNNPNLRWVSATPQTLTSISNAVGIVGGNFTFLFARVNATFNNINYVQVGKGEIIANIPDYQAGRTFWYSVETDNEEEATNFEILTCLPETTTTSTTTTTTEAPCNNILLPGESLKVGETRTSCPDKNVKLALKLMIDGWVIVISDGRDIIIIIIVVIYRSSNLQPPPDKLTMTPEGALIATNPNGEVLWSSAWYSDPAIPGSILTLNPEGYFTIGKDSNITFDSRNYNPLPPCGTFKKYDPINDRSAPEREGVLGGYGYRDKKSQYVGYGNNDYLWACAGQNPCPGYITVDNPGAGVYMSCATGLKFDDQEAYYLVDHPNLEWVATNSSNMLNVPNAIILNGTNGLLWPFMFGRTVYQGEITLGKAHIGNNAFLLNFWGDNGEERYFENFEVLTCTPKLPNTMTTQRLPLTTTTLPGTTTEEPTTLEGQCDNFIPTGECMSVGSERYSCNGLYKTVLQDDGNLVTWTTYDPIKIIWQTNTTDQGAAYACMESNGQLVLTDEDDNPIWASEWVDPDDDPTLIKPILVQNDDGSLTIDSDDGPLWSSGAAVDPPGTTSVDTFEQPHSVPYINPRNTSVILGPCGTFLPYDPINGKYDVDNFGFPGGVHYVNNVVQYVGYGNNTWCGRMDTAPGYVLSGTGCYMPCHRSRNNTFDTQTCKYLAYHPSLRWIPTTPRDAKKVPGALKHEVKKRWSLMYARRPSNGKMNVGRIHYVARDYRFVDSQGYKRLNAKAKVEVLACAACEPPPTLPRNTTTILGPCGTLIPYDPINGRTDPENFGVPGGINYKDGTIEYVGYGDASSCNGMTTAPGYISTKSGSAGAYMPCQKTKSELFNPRGAYYVAYHPDLKWVKTTPLKADKVPGVLTRNVGKQWFLIYARLCTQNLVQLGRIHYVVDKMRFMNANGYQQEGAYTEVEVLTCSKSTDIAEEHPIDATDEPEDITTPTPCVAPNPDPVSPAIFGKCGTLLDYDPINDRTAPELYGVPGGINWRDGSIQYMGYGDASECQNMGTCPGFISTVQGSAGCYMPCQKGKTEYFSEVGCKFIASHPDLRWVKTTPLKADKVPGVLSRNFKGWHMIYARLCANNLVTVGRIHYAVDVVRFVTEKGYQQLGPNTEVEVLACVASSTLPPEPVPEPPLTPCLEPIETPLDTQNLKGPCGTLVPYDPINDRTAPELYGVPGGYSKSDGSIQYVGYGNGKKCAGMDTCPGYISTTLGNAGCRIPCQVGKKLLSDNSPATCSYLAWHPDLEWVTTTPALADKIPGVLTKKFKGWNLMYARTCAADDHTTVGRVHYVVDVMRIFSSTGYQQFGPRSVVDVLRCKNSTEIVPPPVPQDPVCGAPDPIPTDPTKDNGACGTVIPYDLAKGKNDPEKWGVPSGYNFKDGSIQYAGFGNAESCGLMSTCPGYISIEDPAGCYMPCQKYRNESFDNSPSTCFYVAYHPDLKWVTTTPAKADKVPGVLFRNIGTRWYLLYARLCTEDVLTVGRVHYAVDVIRFVNDKGYKQLGSNTEIQVLACQKSTKVAPDAITVSPEETDPPITDTTTTTIRTTLQPHCDHPYPKPLDTSKLMSQTCGTFIKYDPVNGRTDPEYYGMPGGTNWKDGSIEFVGYGNADSCQRMTTCPGYVTTTAGNAGCYMTCQKYRNETFDSKSCYYLSYHPNLRWVETTVSQADKLSGVLFKDVAKRWFLMYARLCVNGKTRVGRIHYAVDVIRFMNDTFGYKQLGANTKVEVLTCVKDPPPPPVRPDYIPPDEDCQVPPTAPKNTTEILGPCGTFVTYDAVNGRTDPQFFGMPGGFNYDDGSIEYVGYGDGTSCSGMTTAPGYISTEIGTAGCKIPCQTTNSELTDTSSSCKYLAYHPDLQWVKTTPALADSIPGVLTRNVGTDWTLMYARLCTPEDDMIQVGRLHYTAENIRYMSSQGYKELGANTEVEVLVCKQDKTLPPPPGTTTTQVPTTTTTTKPTTTPIPTTTTMRPCEPPPGMPVDNTSYSLFGPCGTLVPYDAFDPIKSRYPEMYGVRAGHSWYKKGSYQYVGYGNASTCAAQDKSPGYVMTDLTTGCYMPCHLTRSDVVDRYNCHWLAWHPNLRWVTKTPTRAVKVVGMLRRDSTKTWLTGYGRTCWKNNVRAGRVHLTLDTFRLVDNTGYQNLPGATTIEVLTCVP